MQNALFMIPLMEYKGHIGVRVGCKYISIQHEVDGINRSCSRWRVKEVFPIKYIGWSNTVTSSR